MYNEIKQGTQLAVQHAVQLEIWSKQDFVHFVISLKNGQIRDFLNQKRPSEPTGRLRHGNEMQRRQSGSRWCIKKRFNNRFYSIYVQNRTRNDRQNQYFDQSKPTTKFWFVHQSKPRSNQQAFRDFDEIKQDTQLAVQLLSQGQNKNS